MRLLLLEDTIALDLLFENQLTQILISQSTVLNFYQLCSAFINVFHLLSHFQYFAKFSCESVKKRLLFLPGWMFLVQKKYCQSAGGSIIWWQRHHWTSRTQNAPNIRPRSYDETPLADSCGSSVVHTCKGKAISLPLKFLPFSNCPLFHSSPNKSHFPHSILGLSNKRRKFRQKHPMSAITYISSYQLLLSYFVKQVSTFFELCNPSW